MGIKKFYDNLKKIDVKFILIAIILIVSTIIVKIYDKEPSTNTVSNNQQILTQSPQTVIKDLEILNSTDEYDKSLGSYIITGEVRNNRDYPMRNVFIRFNLYDKDKKLIGDTIDRIDILDANGTWKFRATILNRYKESLKSYRVVELTGYQ